MTGTNLQMQSTRQQILEYLQRHGRGTVKELGSLLGLTSTGIRQHLTVLERDDLVEAREERGRVAHTHLLMTEGRRSFPVLRQAHDHASGELGDRREAARPVGHRRHVARVSA
jgi:predicted ArsR family transcriptional regulator